MNGDLVGHQATLQDQTTHQHADNSTDMNNKINWSLFLNHKKVSCVLVWSCLTEGRIDRADALTPILPAFYQEGASQI